MRIIPAIDIIDGKCVRLSKGDYNDKKIYNENPLEVAKAFEAHGIRFLHLVDLDGAKGKGIVNAQVLENIATHTGLNIDFGGGIKSMADAETAFNSGASQITGGSVAVKDPELFLEWLDRFGTEKIILGADTRNGNIAVAGWLEATNESVIPFIDKYVRNGISRVICTDIEKDGMLEGPATHLYKNILDRIDKVQLIASGGIRDFDDIPKLAGIGCEGAIIGKAIYEGCIRLKQIENYLLC
jgi:phosphoribosylformimino-5-aminoimidazole carboxamide ribotide isomerase